MAGCAASEGPVPLDTAGREASTGRSPRGTRDETTALATEAPPAARGVSGVWSGGARADILRGLRLRPHPQDPSRRHAAPTARVAVSRPRPSGRATGRGTSPETRPPARGRPAARARDSWNQTTSRRASRTDQVPARTPRGTTMLADRLTSSRRAGGTTRASDVPGAITQGSRPGSSRTAVEADAVRRSSRSSRRTRRVVPLDRHGLEPVVERAQPAGDGRPLRPEPLADPVVDPVGAGRTVGVEVRRHHGRPGLLEVGGAGPAGNVVEPAERHLAVPSRPQAHVALPGQRLEQRLVALVDDAAQVPVAAAPAERGGQLREGERPVRQRAPHVLPEPGPVLRRQPVEADPARQLPHPARRPHGQVGAGVLRRHQVGRAPEGEHLHDLRSLRVLARRPRPWPSVRRAPIASSMAGSGQAGTAPSLSTTSATEPVPTGSSS